MPKFQIDGQFYEAPNYAAARAMAKGGGSSAGARPGPSPLAQLSVVLPPSPVVPAAVIIPPALVAVVPVVAPPAPVYHAPEVVVAVAAAEGEINIVHRADGRNLDHSSIIRDKGFACYNGQWCIREVACARAFIKRIIDPSYDTKKIAGFEFANEILTPAKSNFNIPGKKTIQQKDLNDVMVYIKRVLKDTRAFWVSTSLNQECGGYATNMSYNLYRFTLPQTLKQYELILGDPLNTLRPITHRTNDLVPSLCFDGAAPDGSDSKIVAINSGPVNDCEISFLTRIPVAWVRTLRAKVG